MRRAGFDRTTVILAALFVLVLTRQAYGYIDPGTGSFILQVLLASLLGTAVAVKMFWRQIVGYFGKLFSRRRKDDPDER
ncbi:unnamed protein product [marine sediment metagenome]|uniref:Uncharacterized protein n=1 Tax=marine sediment metagenome TaxID=412755 RepID=X1JS00_9ZZZZ